MDRVYFGVHGGGSWGTTDWKSATGALAVVSTSSFAGTGTMDGMIGGGQVGFNRQFGSWVIGGEADASWGNLDGYAKCATTEAPANSFTCHSHIDALGTVTGRLGQAYGNVLIYTRAGGAWAHETHEAARSDIANVFKGSATRLGYTLGSGLEYAFTPAWSGRVEYRYLDFGTKNVSMVDQAGNASNVAMAQRSHFMTLALNYKLGADPATSAMAAYVPPQRSAVFSDWQAEFGTRYWYSTGRAQQDLFDSANPPWSTRAHLRRHGWPFA